MRIFGGDRVKFLMEKLGLPEDQPIAHNMISGAIEQAQGKIEGFNFDTRKYLLEYDDVLNKHREIIYKKRREILERYQVPAEKSKVLEMVEDEIKRIIEFHTASEYADDWNYEEICEVLKTIFPVPHDVHQKITEIGNDAKARKIGSVLARQKILNYFLNLAKENLEKKREEIGDEAMGELEKAILLRTLDMLWMDHLENLDYLKDSVRLQAYGHKDPLVEYKNEAHKMFKAFLREFQSEVVGMIYKVGVVREESERKLRTNKDNVRSVLKKEIGRNDPCPCGSGKKYKKCHGK